MTLTSLSFPHRNSWADPKETFFLFCKKGTLSFPVRQDVNVTFPLFAYLVWGQSIPSMFQAE
jgi:hypothetical protein